MSERYEVDLTEPGRLGVVASTSLNAGGIEVLTAERPALYTPVNLDVLLPLPLDPLPLPPFGWPNPWPFPLNPLGVYGFFIKILGLAFAPFPGPFDGKRKVAAFPALAAA